MSASLRTALSALPQGCPAAMIALPDLPEIDAEDLAHVLASVNLAGAASIWRGATEDGHPGHPIVFRATLFEDLMRVTGDTGGAPVARAHHKDTVLVPLQGNRALNDLDTPEDWDAWRRTLPYQTNT
jgi:CTP:molybdopterin cytidylyltransferase MocA